MAGPPPREAGAGADGALRVVARGAAGWPAALDDLPDPPARLWIRGGWHAAAPAVAVVGARAATDYGLGMARRLGADLARAGIVVVSGLARGVDAAAHEGALEAGGTTVAVLPGGVAPVHPRHHERLAARVASSGALLAEHPPGTPAYPGAFLARNRLIAALARATVVVEAAERSGALATAARARALGRTVLAVPGDVDRATSRGTNRLLRDGARPCLEAADAFGAAGLGAGAATGTTRGGGGETPAAAAGSAAARLLARLDGVPRGVEELAAGAGLAIGETLTALLELEWAGAAEARPGQRWRRRP